jgi:hypothetical protein
MIKQVKILGTQFKPFLFPAQVVQLSYSRCIAASSIVGYCTHWRGWA